MLSDLLSFLRNAFFQLADRLSHIHLILLGIVLILFYCFDQVLDRLFKIKKLSVSIGRHRLKMNGECKNKIIMTFWRLLSHQLKRTTMCLFNQGIYECGKSFAKG